MNIQTIFVLGAATIGSFSLALLIQWLTLRALIIVLPGRHKLSAAQAAMLHTRRLVMPAQMQNHAQSS